MLNDDKYFIDSKSAHGGESLTITIDRDHADMSNSLIKIVDAIAATEQNINTTMGNHNKAVIWLDEAKTTYKACKDLFASGSLATEPQLKRNLAVLLKALVKELETANKLVTKQTSRSRDRDVINPFLGHR